jgi:quercetin dioxygenase-like cupin family protein
MNKWRSFCVAFAVLLISLTGMAQEQGVVKPQLLLNEIVQGMPKGEKQEVRVLTASFKPGDKTMFHTHRFPVTVYVLEGAFTLEMGGREPVTVKAGQATTMPPHVKMTGYNRSSTDPLRLVLFNVGDPGTPYLEPVHQQ